MSKQWSFGGMQGDWRQSFKSHSLFALFGRSSHRNEELTSHNNMYKICMEVYISFVHNGLKLKVTQVSFNGCVTGLTKVHLYCAYCSVQGFEVKVPMASWVDLWELCWKNKVGHRRLLATWCHCNSFFFKNFYLFIFGCSGSSLLHRFSLVAASRGYFLVAVLRLLIVVASLFAEHGF